MTDSEISADAARRISERRPTSPAAAARGECGLTVPAGPSISRQPELESARLNGCETTSAAHDRTHGVGSNAKRAA
jgi:hypothetical protein